MSRRTRAPLLSGVALFLLASCRGDRLPEGEGGARALAAGRRTYEKKCASCHGMTGDGKTVTANRFPYANLIDQKWRSDGSPGAIEKQIRKGHDPMPSFQGKLTDQEIRDTTAYVIELSRRKTR